MEFNSNVLITIILIALVAIIVAIIVSAINISMINAKLEKTIEVTVHHTLVDGGKYSYTECVYEYEGRRYITNFEPCTAGPGETLLVNIDKNGDIITGTEKYDN